MILTIYISVILFILGIVLGSFYNVVATRLPNNISIVKPGSHCEYCNRNLRWYENIPLVSYIIQGGKCRGCKHKLSITYLFTELFTGLAFVGSYLYFGISYEFYVSLILASLATLIFVSDFKYMIILDSPLLISGILIFVLKIIYFGYKEAMISLLSGAIVFCVMLLVGLIGKVMYKRDALGGGDIKLSIVIGLLLKIELSMVCLILSTFLALPYALATILLKKDSEVPFGPFIVSAFIIVFVFVDKFYNIVKLFYIF